MGRLRLDLPGSHYLGLFDAVEPKLYPGEAEVTFLVGDEELTVALPAADDAPEPAAVAAARSALALLPELHEQALAWLRGTPGWPYGDDALLWIVLVEHDNVRLCFRQESVNDEQVIGFRRAGEDWALAGPDARFRTPPEPLDRGI